MRARDRYQTSETARFRPLAPVGGTMWAASPARKRLPCRMGSATKLRSGAIDFALDGPVVDGVGGVTLHVVTAEHGAAPGGDRESALVAGVEELLQGRRLRQD